MKIIHRISFSANCNSKVFKKLTKLGIEPWPTGGKLFSNMRHFDISEDNSIWPQVKEIIENNKMLDIPMSEFSKDEILLAEWVRLAPAYFEDNNFPEPHLDESWKKVSFDYENECHECGIGLLQKAPIRIKGEPNLKNNDFISIFWTYAIFSRPEVLNTIMENNIRGFEMFPVINHSSNLPLETVKQMRIINELSPCLVADNLQIDERKCGHVKYYDISHVKKKYKRQAFNNCPDLIRTSEWFGTGYEAYQLILASANFVKVFMENNWKGLSLIPIEII
jgi:hypothetical protein